MKKKLRLLNTLHCVIVYFDTINNKYIVCVLLTIRSSPGRVEGLPELDRRKFLGVSFTRWRPLCLNLARLGLWSSWRKGIGTVRTVNL